MNPSITINDIEIRTQLKPGDLGYVVYRHGKIYGDEYGYGLSFEAYVASGISEFYRNYNAEMDRAWICEHNGHTVGFLLLMHRENGEAQLRYFYLESAYRGIGLGNKLMSLYMDFLVKCGYKTSFLLTTHELASAAYLYMKYGFKLAGEKESTAFGKPVREQRYELVVNRDIL